MSAALEHKNKQKFWESLLLRILSVLVLLPIALGAMWYGSPYFEALVSIIAVFTCFEWVHLICNKQNLNQDLLTRLTFLFLITLVGLIFFLAIGNYTLAGLTFLSVFISTYLVKRKIAGNVYRWWFYGIFVLGLPYISILWLRSLPILGRELIFFLFIITWVTDSLAFFAGNVFKGPKLAPKISPNKTWSGSITGLIGAALIGALAPLTLGSATFASFSPKLILIAILISIAVQLGDLLESWAKRLFGVKDSSNLIPGHGGFLDRLDGLFLSTPLLALIIYFFKEVFTF